MRKVLHHSKALEEKRPLTRSLIDSMIEEVEKELEEAVAKKDYSSCPPLQQRLDELNKKKEEYPTIQELRQKLEDIAKAVDDAAANRDFAGAAARQAAVDHAKRRLETALAVEGIASEDDAAEDLVVEETEESPMPFSSRSELEDKIKSIKMEVDKAITEKDFKTASAHQEALNELECYR